MAGLVPRLVLAGWSAMRSCLLRQWGWALAGSVLVCGLISASTLAAWLDLAHAQQGLAHRLWSLQALRAAEAVLRDAQSAGSNLGTAPAQGCIQGLCAWQGTNGLTRAHWQSQLDQAAWGGCRASWASGWPTLPQTRMACWVEHANHLDGTLWRFTAWVQGPSNQLAVMQAVWQNSPQGSAWVSWREVMP